jgi:hypothetical protein
LEVFQSGAKRWRFRYKFPRANRISLGTYPNVSLAEAREACDENLKLLAQGIDPSTHKKAKKAVKAGQAEDSFETVAREWLKKFIDKRAESHRKRVSASSSFRCVGW